MEFQDPLQWQVMASARGLVDFLPRCSCEAYPSLLGSLSQALLVFLSQAFDDLTMIECSNVQHCRLKPTSFHHLLLSLPVIDILMSHDVRDWIQDDPYDSGSEAEELATPCRAKPSPSLNIFFLAVLGCHHSHHRELNMVGIGWNWLDLGSNRGQNQHGHKCLGWNQHERS